MYNSLLQVVRCLLVSLSLLIFSVGLHGYDPHYSRGHPSELTGNTVTPSPSHESRKHSRRCLFEIEWLWWLKTAQIQLRKRFRNHFHIQSFTFDFTLHCVLCHCHTQCANYAKYAADSVLWRCYRFTHVRRFWFDFRCILSANRQTIM